MLKNGKFPTPCFHLPIGTQMTWHGRVVHIVDKEKNGYTIHDRTNGFTEFMDFTSLSECMKYDDFIYKTPHSTAVEADIKNHTGRFSRLSEKDKCEVRYKVAICTSIDDLVHSTTINSTNERRPIKLTRSFLSDKNVQKLLNQKAVDYIEVDNNDKRTRGGLNTSFKSYSGKKLFDMYRKYKSCTDKPGEISIYDILSPNHSAKGNGNARMHYRAREITLKALREAALNKKRIKISNIYNLIQGRISAENRLRTQNNQEPIAVPSQAAIKKTMLANFTKSQIAVGQLGREEAINRYGSGHREQRSQVVGERVEMDEYNLSLILDLEDSKLLEQLTDEQKKELEKADAFIKSRVHIVVAIDTATRMPLAWVVTLNPSAQAAIEALRMATRSKERERIKHGCRQPAMPAVNLAKIVIDNGSALRSKAFVESCLHMGWIVENARAGSPGDKPVIERLFNTLETSLLRVLTGYTGANPLELPDYDSEGAGVLLVHELEKFLAKYFIDIYPNTPHHGVGSFGRTPYEMYLDANENYGLLTPPNPDMRRIALGNVKEVTPNPNGVRLEDHLHYHSNALKEAFDKHHFPKKVQLFYDPDDISTATIAAQKWPELITVHNTMTAFSHLTYDEGLAIVDKARTKHLDRRTLSNEILLEARMKIFEDNQEAETTRGASPATISDRALDAASKALVGKHPERMISGAALSKKSETPVMAPGTIGMTDIATDSVFRSEDDILERMPEMPAAFNESPLEPSHIRDRVTGDEDDTGLDFRKPDNLTGVKE